MANNIDIYAPCPCGSGKKIKFCCQGIVEDMLRVEELRADGESRLALKTLEPIEKTQPDNPWVLSNKLGLLLEDSQLDEARTVCLKLLEISPRHPFALFTDALLDLRETGVEASLEKMELALQHSRAPGLALLAESTGMLHAQSGRVMASRRYLQLMCELTTDELKQSAYSRLLEFEGLRGVPYLYRSDYGLKMPAEPVSDELKESIYLATRGCWKMAAERFAKAAETLPDDAALWYNGGLCAAWSGDSIAGAERLHRAAELFEDFDQATEVEALAQLLDQENPANRTEVTPRHFHVKSVARLLGDLPKQPRIVRLTLPPDIAEQSDRPPTAVFRILDREPSGRPETPDAVPVVLGEMTIYPELPEQSLPATAFLFVMQGADVAEITDLVTAAAGDQLELQADSPDADQQLDSFPNDFLALNFRWHFADDVPFAEQRKLTKQKWDMLVNTTWPNSPLKSLGGKTPVEAVSEESLQLPLAAAVIVFDTFCDQHQHVLQLEDVRSRLHVPEPQPITVNEALDIDSLNLLQLRRVPLQELSDEQLSSVVIAADVLRHSSFMYDVLTEVIARPSTMSDFDATDAYRALVDLCRERNSREEGMAWLNKGREYSRDHGDAFQHRVMWDLKELTVRLDNPTDPQIGPILNRIRTKYCPKLPELGTQLDQLLAAHQYTPSLLGEGTSSGEALWTPGSVPAGEAGKLWLPGQE